MAEVTAVVRVVFAVWHFRELLIFDVDAVVCITVLGQPLHDVPSRVEALGTNHSAFCVVGVGEMCVAAVHREELPSISNDRVKVRVNNDFVVVCTFRAGRQEQNSGKESKEMFHRFVYFNNVHRLAFSVLCLLKKTKSA